MKKSLKQTKEIENFYEKLLFTVFVECVVIKNSELFDFTRIKTLQRDPTFPIQIASLLERYSRGDTLDKVQEDVKNFFILYMNYKHLFQLEYFDDNLQKWRLLDSTKLSSLTNKVLCRVTPYINEKLGILKNDDIQFSIVNQHFILGS